MPGWLKGCAIGCGIAVLLTVVTFVGCGFSLMQPFKEAQEVRETLEADFGTQADYVPPADGRVAPARLEAFLAVQEELQGMCSELEGVFSHFERMERMDDDSVGTGEKVGLVFGAIGRGIQLPRLLGRFHVTRNEALAAQGMGLGEYTYIYVTGYYGVLGRRGHSLDDHDNVEIEGGRNASRRLRGVLRDMLRNQLAALDAQDGDPDLRRELRDEVLRLEDDLSRLPWQDGVPASIAEPFAPYRGRLDALWCPYADEFALTVARQGNKGFSITTD